MKKFILIFAAILFVACQQPMDSDVIGIVKSSDEKTQIILSDLENYLAYGTDKYDAELPANLVTMDLAGNFADQTVDYEAFLAVAAEPGCLGRETPPLSPSASSSLPQVRRSSLPTVQYSSDPATTTLLAQTRVQPT